MEAIAQPTIYRHLELMSMNGHLGSEGGSLLAVFSQLSLEDWHLFAQRRESEFPLCFAKVVQELLFDLDVARRKPLETVSKLVGYIIRLDRALHSISDRCH